MLHYKRLEEIKNKSKQQCEIALQKIETDPLVIKRIEFANQLGYKRMLKYHFNKLLNLYIIRKTHEARIALMYNLRYFRRWKKKWKKKRKRIKRMNKWKKYLFKQKMKRMIQGWHVYSKQYKKIYRTSSKAMQIQRIINGDLPGPNKHIKCNNILRLDDDLVSIDSNWERKTET
tara:strand:- start:35 stop:556 length:522 start_codon:yes stop_codon:yes gene_type:complete